MALIALAYLMAIPVFSKTMDFVKLEADARQICAVLRMARQEAITSGQSRTVIFYPSNAKYEIYGQAINYLNSGITFEGTTTFTSKFGGLPACGFSPSGSPSSGGTVTLQNGSDHIYIVVNPVAGRVRMSANPPAD